MVTTCLGNHLSNLVLLLADLPSLSYRVSKSHLKNSGPVPDIPDSLHWLLHVAANRTWP